MKLQGTTHINAARETVFNSFTDANFVAACAPDVRSLDVIEPHKRFKVIVGIGFGAVKATFDTDVEFLDKTPHDYAKIRAVGNAPGSNADVVAELYLSDAVDGGADLRWAADVVITGAIASVAARLLDSVAQQISTQFFERAKAAIERG